MENRFSVIIPTVLKCIDVTNDLLRKLYDDPAVGEVIIIDNYSEDIEPWSYGCVFEDTTYYSSGLLWDEKTVYRYPGENIYVNPAWNLGVSISKYDNIVLGSDDVIIPENVLSALSTIDLKPMGLLGIARDTIYDQDADVNQEMTELKMERTTDRTWGYGIFMVLHKDNYYQTPNEIKIWCGDDLQFKWQDHNGRFNYKMYVPIKTKMSTTSDLPQYDEVKQNDLRLFHALKF